MDVSSGLHVKRVEWNPRGTNLVFSDSTFAILGFPSIELVGGGGFTEVKQMAGFVTSPTGKNKMKLSLPSEFLLKYN